MQGIQADGNHVREGRDDLLYDVCFYFIGPNCYTPMDREYIKLLSTVCTVIPIWAKLKADAMTDDECWRFQKQIQDDLRARE